eukprot:jgi/Ulvmu1/4350/UM002_0074.1
MRDVWAREGEKGARAMRKKALVDSIKSLLELGLSGSRAAVPPDERTPCAWFMSEQQEILPGLAHGTAETMMQLPNTIATSLQRTWCTACSHFHKMFAAVNILKDTVRSSLHADISQLEASRMCAVSDHLLHIMRRQQRAAYISCRQICALEHLCQLLLDTLVSPCESFDHASCGELLDTVASSVYDVIVFCRQIELLQPSSEAMMTASLTSTFKSASKAVAAILESLEAVQRQLEDATAAVLPPVSVCSGAQASGAGAARAPLLFTPALLGAMVSACTALHNARERVRRSGEVGVAQGDVADQTRHVTVADVFPCWGRLQAMLTSITLKLSGLRNDLPELPSVLRSDSHAGRTAAGTTGLSAEHLVRLSEAGGAALKESLLWAQGTKRVADKQQGLWLLLPEAAAVCEAFLHSACAGRLCIALQACVTGASRGSPFASAELVPMRSKLRAVLACSQTVLAGMRASLAYAVLLHAATGHLAVAAASMFLEYARAGLGDGEGEVEDGEAGEGTGAFKEADGVGLGDGDTANAQDVSNQVESEDQIMGAQQQQGDDAGVAPDEDDSKPDRDNDEQQGIEMQQDFEGEMDDIPKDGGADASEDKHAELDFDEEMGDAGNDADIVDEKMWLGDTDEAEETREDKKDAGMADDAGQENGDPEARKLVAGGQDDAKEASSDHQSQPETEQPKVMLHNAALLFLLRPVPIIRLIAVVLVEQLLAG